MASQNADAATQAFGPHKGYATTTIKCAVCHSVHRGGNTMLTAANGAGCAYCHSETCAGGGGVATNRDRLVLHQRWPAQRLRLELLPRWPARRRRLDLRWSGHHACSSSAADAEADTLATANGVTAATTYATWNANSRALGTAAVCGRARLPHQLDVRCCDLRCHQDAHDPGRDRHRSPCHRCRHEHVELHGCVRPRMPRRPVRSPTLA